MISKTVNVSTGPIGITREVQYALQEPVISHRSPDFGKIYNQTTGFLCEAFQVRDCYLATGSGTLANEIMLQEIRSAGGKGLILSNGEFGERLINQANRNELDFITYKTEWGNPPDMNEIKNLLSTTHVKWLLCCHCETSTGMIIDLHELTRLAQSFHCMCFVDCMSSVGTVPLNLSGVTMATGSSGKGLASIPGLAVIFSNVDPVPKRNCPVYLDLDHYRNSSGIPFTIPSNLLKALNVSVKQKLIADQFELIKEYRKTYYTVLNEAGLVPFSREETSVFTITTDTASHDFTNRMLQKEIVISYESDYLKKRKWCQLATFGYYTEKQLKQVSNALMKYY